MSAITLLGSREDSSRAGTATRQRHGDAPACSVGHRNRCAVRGCGAYRQRPCTPGPVPPAGPPAPGLAAAARAPRPVEVRHPPGLRGRIGPVAGDEMGMEMTGPFPEGDHIHPLATGQSAAPGHCSASASDRRPRPRRGLKSIGPPRWRRVSSSSQPEHGSGAGVMAQQPVALAKDLVCVPCACSSPCRSQMPQGPCQVGDDRGRPAKLR